MGRHSRCFDGIQALEFTADTEIVAMKSTEGERVALVERIRPHEYEGAVEKWLKMLERDMQDSVAEQPVAHKRFSRGALLHALGG